MNQSVKAFENSQSVKKALHRRTVGKWAEVSASYFYSSAASNVEMWLIPGVTRTETGFGVLASLFVFNSDIFVFFILATEADSEDSGVVHERGQPPSSPE